MSASQRRKGQRGEREACAVLEALTGVAWERSARQSGPRGGEGMPDVVPVGAPPGGARIHPEVKIGAAPPVLRALEQAVRDARGGAIPIALVRRDRGEWVLAVRASDVLELARILTRRGRCQ